MNITGIIIAAIIVGATGIIIGVLDRKSVV